ncbi:MAG: hypothetical protein ACI814_001291, partial [Mariniblastus sp.]
QQPSIANAKPCGEFQLANDVTFLVEIKNDSAQEIKLQGVRFGEGVSKPWPGKSKQATFGPLLFEIRVFDALGGAVTPPSSEVDDSVQFLQASGGSVESLKPNDTVTMLVKPIAWDISWASSLAAGEYSAELVYHGTTPAVQAELRKHWPDKPLSNVWNGEAVSPKIVFKVQHAYRDQRPALAWGQPKNGLRVAAEYRLSDTRAENSAEFVDRVFPIGSQVNVRYHIQNTTNKPIEFKSELWRQDDRILRLLEDSEEEIRHPWYSGIARHKSWTLQPKQIINVDAIPLSFPPDSPDPTFRAFGAEIETGVGEYRIKHDLKNGLETGVSTLTLRSRRDSDQPRVFAADLVFTTPPPAPPRNGFVKVTTQSGGKLLFEGEVKAGVLKLPKWTGENLSVYVRFPGFQENTYFDVAPVKDSELSIELLTADPIKFRLIDDRGQPIAGAKIRHFVRTRSESESYPFPVTGTQGVVLAESNEHGHVVLDSVQSGYLYTFFVQPKRHAARFVSAIEAGENLAELELVMPFEVSGVIQGTPEQLKRFSAEWDQAVAILLKDGTSNFEYANSKKLAVQRDGDQLTFRLSNLRPGKLRIIANVQQRKRVNHEYAKRTVGDDDQLFTFELMGPRNDLILQVDPK